MKKHIFLALALIVTVFFFGCTNSDQTQQKNSEQTGKITNPQPPTPSQSEQITNPAPGTRYVVNNDTGESFSITGETVTATKVIGVQHDKSSPVVDPEFVIPYNAFWFELFKSETKRDSASRMILAAEIDPGFIGGPKKMVIGQVIMVQKPQFFITPYLFAAGVNRLAISDTRPHTQRAWDVMTKADDLFSQRGGRMKTEGVDEYGFPNVVLVKKPILTPSDRLFLRKQWYEEVYLQDQAFEQKVFDLTKKGAIGVVGAGHAYKIFQRHGVPVALIASEQNIHLAVMRVKIHELYLEELGLN